MRAECRRFSKSLLSKICINSFNCKKISLSKIFEKFHGVFTGREPDFDVNQLFLETSVASAFLSNSGKVPVIIQLLKISVNFSE